MTVPQVADLLECNNVTVRGAVHRCEDGGFETLADAPRPGRPPSITREDRKALAALLDESACQGRTWTTAALCDWLRAECGVRAGAAWLTDLLHRDGFRWKRTRDTLRHTADPVLQQAARARLEDLRLAADTGVSDMYILDESGFAPTMPTGNTWPRQGSGPWCHVRTTRAGACTCWVPCRWDRVPTWCGRRPAARSTRPCCWSSCARSGLVCPAGLEEFPAGRKRARPCTVVLDNASAHVARAFKGRREGLAAVGVELFSLPPRSPELNDIERMWRAATYEDYPERVHTTSEAVGNAVDQALARQRTRIKGSATNFTQAA
ncbi:IS630 family transposase [Streptomyces violaceusniger]|uniref:Tc1-like transposase DDE domain-containing protein n=1 Tax=Streptomyces violaceusniger TaxID=68280 RepID=A0A4D4LQ25_STRVO|nr:hypothetical protein SVIO_109300 [Streptomyces violaceusniger]